MLLSRKNNLANFAAVLHDCVFTSATEMDSNGRTFSVLVPHCLLLSFWKKDVPPPETWHAILQLTKSRFNGYPTITQHLALLFNYQFEALPIINPYKSQTNNVDLSTKVAIESLPTQYYSHVSSNLGLANV